MLNRQERDRQKHNKISFEKVVDNFKKMCYYI